MAVCRFKPEPHSKIIIQSDCIAALEAADRQIFKVPKVIPYDIEVRIWINEIRGKHKLILDFRHVKGHQGKSAGKRHAVNEWCDAECYGIARAERDRLLGRGMKQSVLEDI